MAVEIDRIDVLQRIGACEHDRPHRAAGSDAVRRHDTQAGNPRNGGDGYQRQIGLTVAQCLGAASRRRKQQLRMQARAGMFDTVDKGDGIQVGYRSYSVPHHHPYSIKRSLNHIRSSANAQSRAVGRRLPRRRAAFPCCEGSQKLRITHFSGLFFAPSRRKALA